MAVWPILEAPLPPGALASSDAVLESPRTYLREELRALFAFRSSSVRPASFRPAVFPAPPRCNEEWLPRPLANRFPGLVPSERVVFPPALERHPNRARASRRPRCCRRLTEDRWQHHSVQAPVWGSL